jgi:hypothetical protein
MFKLRQFKRKWSGSFFVEAPVIIFVVFLVGVVLFTGFWNTVSTTIFPNTTWGLYSRDFFANLLAALHGNIADFFVVGIIVYWFDRRRAAKDKVVADNLQRDMSIRRNREALEDIASYKGQDAAYRTMTIIKRLIELGSNPIICTNAVLSGLTIRNIKLFGSKLHGADFSNSSLEDVDFQSSTLDAANFSNTAQKRGQVHLRPFEPQHGGLCAGLMPAKR